MPITVGYEPVQAIGQMAMGAGRGAKAEYDAEIARKQAEADANRQWQLKMQTITKQMEADDWKEKAKFQSDEQAKRDERLHEQDLEKLSVTEENDFRQKAEDLRIRAEHAEAERKAKFREQYEEFTPEAQVKLDGLKSDIVKIIENPNLSDVEKQQAIAPKKAQMDQIQQDPYGINYKRKDGAKTPEELQQEWNQKVVDIELVPGRKVKGYFDKNGEPQILEDPLEKEFVKQKAAVEKQEQAEVQRQIKDIKSESVKRSRELRTARSKAEEDLREANAKIAVKENKIISADKEDKPEIEADLQGLRYERGQIKANIRKYDQEQIQVREAVLYPDRVYQSIIQERQQEEARLQAEQEAMEVERAREEEARARESQNPSGGVPQPPQADRIPEVPAEVKQQIEDKYKDYL